MRAAEGKRLFVGIEGPVVSTSKVVKNEGAPTILYRILHAFY